MRPGFLQMVLILAAAATPVPALAGGAVVLDAGAKAELPPASALRKGTAALAQPYRPAGLNVATDPTGRIVAAWTPRHVNEALFAREVDRHALPSIALFEQVTPQQYSARHKGYILENQLSPAQLLIARQTAKRAGHLDAQGKPRRSGEHIAVELKSEWLLHVAAREKDGRTRSVQLSLPNSPPTTVAIPAPVLKGSPLWYSWAGADATWGKRKISINPGLYSLGNLAARLSDATVQVKAAPEVAAIRLRLAAESVPARDLIWAIGLASGSHAAVSQGPILTLSAPETVPIGYRDYDSLQPIIGLGYYSPASAQVGPKILSRIQGGAGKGANWVGWRLSDLPVMYQSQIRSDWRRAYEFGVQKPVPELTPDARVIWTKGIFIGIGTQRDDGSGGGTPVWLSTF